MSLHRLFIVLVVLLNRLIFSIILNRFDLFTGFTVISS